MHTAQQSNFILTKSLSIQINDKYILKSGTDFREFSHVEISCDDGNKSPSVTISKVEVTSKYEADPAVKEALLEYESKSS